MASSGGTEILELEDGGRVSGAEPESLEDNASDSELIQAATCSLSVL